MARATTNLTMPRWTDHEKNWLMKEFKRGKTAAQVQEIINKRYHKGKAVRTLTSVAQRRWLLMGAMEPKKTKKPEKHALARVRKAPVSVEAQFSPLEEAEPPKWIVAIQTPGLKGSVQLEGSKGSNALLRKVTDVLVKSI